jgi:hypothetical protein
MLTWSGKWAWVNGLHVTRIGRLLACCSELVVWWGVAVAVATSEALELICIKNVRLAAEQLCWTEVRGDSGWAPVRYASDTWGGVFDSAVGCCCCCGVRLVAWLFRAINTRVILVIPRRTSTPTGS